jgi:hypothetical protein
MTEIRANVTEEVHRKLKEEAARSGKLRWSPKFGQVVKIEFCP